MQTEFPIFRSDNPEGDWVQDITELNGQYMCRCITCKGQFIGMKRRSICYKCKPEWNLFLDDIRNPEDAYSYTKFDKFKTDQWHVARNYEQFVTKIRLHGLPVFISFDHDLADEHLTPKELWSDYDKSKEWQSGQEYKEMTGLDCAKWLVEFCLTHGFELPEFYVHSMNPVGKDNILKLLQNAKRHIRKSV